MVRWGMLVAGTAVVAGAAFVAGSSVPPRVPPARSSQPVDKVAATLPHRVGYYNHSRVMKDYKRSTDQLARLNGRRERMMRNVFAMRAMGQELQARLNVAPLEQRDALGREMIVLTRTIEDMDREMNKKLTDRASSIVTMLFRELTATVGELARDHHLHAVHAFPAGPADAVHPQLMEILLKPPALQPMYLDPSVDFTDELIRRLNEKYDAEEGDN